MKWFWNMCKAVDYIHQKDVWHRDLKPANVFLDAKGSVKIGGRQSAYIFACKHNG